MARQNLTLTGTVFTDYLLNSVGAAAFQLEHDWFIKQDLVIRSAAGGGGVLLIEGVDYNLVGEATDLSTRVSVAVGAGRNVYHQIQVINAAYQACALYFSGKSVGDSVAASDWNCPKFLPQPWMKNLAAVCGTTLFSNVCNADVSMALKDTTKNFATVAFGDICENTTARTFATVLYKSGADTLYLDADIFPVGNEAYKVYSQPAVALQDGLDDFIELTGAKLDGDGAKVADNDTLNHLKDADGTGWTGLVAVGDWAMNLATGKIAQVTVVGNHDLTLQWDAFPGGNEKYMIFAGTVTVALQGSPILARVIPEVNIGGRYFGGGITAGRAEDDSFMAHWHDFHYSYTVANTGATQGNAPENTKSSNTAISTGEPVRDAHTDGIDGTPRATDHTQPRTLRATMIMKVR